jgi:hypothetical protein
LLLGLNNPLELFSNERDSAIPFLMLFLELFLLGITTELSSISSLIGVIF